MTAIACAPAAPSESAPPSPWVLIIDDERDNRELLAEFLELAGYGAITCGSAAEANQILDAEGPPCLVIADVRMPDVDGPTFVAALRQRPGFSALPVIFVTGLDVGRLGTIREQVLAKPLDLDVLMEIVERHCGSETGRDTGCACG
jgi:CheY-like chemotaxis protein